MKRPDVEKAERQAVRYIKSTGRFGRSRTKWERQLELVKYIKHLESKLGMLEDQ